MLVVKSKTAVFRFVMKNRALTLTFPTPDSCSPEVITFISLGICACISKYALV